MGQWTNERLGSYLNFRNGKTSPDRFELGPFTVFGSNGAIGQAKAANADADTIVIGRVGTYCGSLHYSSSPCWVTDNAIICTPPKNEGRFWVYALSSLDLNNYRTGSGQPLLNQSILKQISFRAPTASERIQIGAFLGGLDDKIELNRRMNETLESMAQAIFKDWFVEFGPTRAKVEGRGPYLAPDLWDLFPGDLDAADVPKGWQAGPLGDRIVILDSKRIPLSAREREQRRGPYPYHGATGVMDYVDDFLFEGVHVLLGEDGSVVKPDGKPFTQYVWGQFWVNNHAHVLRGKDISNEMLLCFLQHTDIAPYVTGAVQPKLNQKNLKTIPFPAPDPDVAAAFERVVGPLFEQIRLNAEQTRKLSTTRDLILPKLMSGEIRLADAEKGLEAVA